MSTSEKNNQVNTGGKKEGLYISRHLNNGVWCSGNYLNSIQDGLWEYFFSNGNLSLRCNYKNGNLCDLYEEFDSEGNLIKKIFYVNM